jgi:hypothetical protein
MLPFHAMQVLGVIMFIVAIILARLALLRRVLHCQIALAVIMLLKLQLMASTTKFIFSTLREIFHVNN